MYFTASTLAIAARGYYAIGNGVIARQYKAYSEEAHAALTAGEMIQITHIGPARLHMYGHAWSGAAQIVTGGTVRVADLYSEDPADSWIDLPAAGGALTQSYLIGGIGTANPLAKGMETWLIGISFVERQPWQVLAMPMSDYAEAAIGQVGSFIIPMNDQILGPSLKHTGIWAADDIAFFRTVIAPGDVVFDIGANIGHHAVAFSTMVGPTGKVVAFEPQNLIYWFACGNLAINRCLNTDLRQWCLGEEDGSLRMSPVSYDDALNFGAIDVSPVGTPGGAGAGELVRVVRLDTVLASGEIDVERIDFIKIDVESYELFVLNGAIEALRRFKPRLFVEISPLAMRKRGYDYRAIYDLLRGLGYRFRHFHDAPMIDDVPQWTSGVEEIWDVYAEVP